MYKPILPSSLLSLEKGEFDAFDKNFNDFALKSGVVVATYEVDDKNNLSKSNVEYDVLAVEQVSNLGTSSVLYKKCTVMEGFGSISDYFEVKKRKPSKDPNKEKDPQNLNGTIVLLLCLHGSKDKGIIIGALKHPKRKSKLTKDKEHHLEGEFNGVNWQIDKDGALTIKFKSASDNDGKYKDEKAGGATIKMEKDGSIEASDGNKEKIRIDKTKKTIDLIAESDISATSDANVNITAKKNINAKATSDLLADAGGSITLKSGAAFKVEASAAITVKGASVEISSDGSAKLKGSMIELSAPTVMVGSGGTPAVTMNTQCFGIGNLGSPIISTMIGPFSSSVMIGL